MVFRDLPVGAKFTTEAFLEPRVKVWEKVSDGSCKGFTPRGKKVQHLLFDTRFEVKQVQP